MVKIKEYIESGALELYVLGVASDAETEELMYLKKKYPEVQEALWELEVDLENLAQRFAIAPPPGGLARIEATISELIRTSQEEDLIVSHPFENSRTYLPKDSELIDLESNPKHIRILKVWGWIFAAIFLLGLVFLAAAAYFHHQNSQAEQELDHLRKSIKKEDIH